MMATIYILGMCALLSSIPSASSFTTPSFSISFAAPSRSFFLNGATSSNSNTNTKHDLMKRILGYSNCNRGSERSNARAAKIVIYLSKDTDDEENNNKNSKKKSNSMMNRVGKIGNRVMKRISRSKDSESSASEEGGEISDETPIRPKKDTSRTSKSFLSMFSSSSEASLAAALKRQQALDAYVSGSEQSGGKFNQELPPELVTELDDKDDFFDAEAILNEAISSIEENLASVRDEISFITPRRDQNEEKKRLNELRRNLEQRRKKLMLEEQRRAKETDLKKEIQKERKRQAIANAKIKKLMLEEKELNRRKGRELDKITQGIAKMSKNDTTIDNTFGEENTNKNNSTGGTVDNVFSNAQSLITNTIQSTFKKGKDKISSKQKQWVPVCTKTRISPGEVVPVVAAGLDLLIVGSLDGTKVHCIANSCPHLGTPLETGPLQRRPCDNEECNTAGVNSSTGGLVATSTKPITRDGFEECIVCPLHQTAFALETGEVNGEWCPYPPVIGKVVGTIKPEANLPTFELRTRGKNLEVRINSCLED